MIKPPSLQKVYTLVFSGDPALDLPEDAEEKALALKNARETGNWPIRPGESPTLFHFDPVSHLVPYIHGEVSRGKLIDEELAALVFRLALSKVDGFGDRKVEFERDEDGHRVIAGSSMAMFYDVGRDAGLPDLGRQIVYELGGLVFARARDPIVPLL